MLAPDVVLLSDGGGVVPAARVPVVGAAEVAAVLGGIAAELSLGRAQVNGRPALILRRAGAVDTVMALHVVDGLVAGLYAVRNPQKLSRVDRETLMTR